MSATPSSTTAPLTGRTVALSISESPDLASLGMRDLHLKLAMQEMARYLLAQGATLAYGGDLRTDGFTEQLFHLVNTYRRGEEKVVSRVKNYLAWPIHLTLKPGQRQAWEQVATFVFLPAPEVPTIPITHPNAVPANDLEGRYLSSISLTAMRRKMHEDCQARILLGGKLSGYSGHCPGLLEEAWLALQAELPVYVVGGYGGCTGRIAKALQGERVEEFTEEYQLKEAERLENPLKELRVFYRSERVPKDPWLEALDYAEVTERLKEIGPSGLNNGLSPEENLRLFRSPYLAEIIQLVLKGLQKVATTSLEK